MSSDVIIPAGFEMGVATSSWQIEGDVAGRGRCNWDDFADLPGTVVDGATGEPACDHVNRLDEDLDLLAWLGVDAYRFSISWPRVMPDGVGTLSDVGVGFYDRLIDGLVARGIKPVATLFHWDLPSGLEAVGGWTNRDTAYRFADYAEAMAIRYADRVDRWATLNEPWCSAFLGYCSGYFAPGRTEPGASLSAAYHLILGHGLATERLRRAGARNVGIVLNLIPVISERPTMDAAAAHVDRLQNGIFLDLLAGYDKAVIIDAIQTGEGKPGQIYRLQPGAFRETRHAATPHDVSFTTALELGKMLKLPLPAEIVIFGIEAQDVVNLSEGCTPEVERAVPVCAEMVLAELSSNGIV